MSGTPGPYVKPHGALYNAIVHHQDQAAAVVEAVVRYDPALAVLGLPGSRFLEIAQEAGLQVVPEAFADRAYLASATLVPRREPGAVSMTSTTSPSGACNWQPRSSSTRWTAQPSTWWRRQCASTAAAWARSPCGRSKAALEDAGVAVAPFVSDT